MRCCQVADPDLCSQKLRATGHAAAVRLVRLVAGVIILISAWGGLPAEAAVKITFDGEFATVGPGGVSAFRIDFYFGPGQANDDNTFLNGWNQIHLQSAQIVSGNYCGELFGGLGTAALGVGVNNGALAYALLVFAQGPVPSASNPSDTIGLFATPEISVYTGAFLASDASVYPLSQTTLAAMVDSRVLDGWSFPQQVPSVPVMCRVPEASSYMAWCWICVLSATVIRSRNPCFMEVQSL